MHEEIVERYLRGETIAALKKRYHLGNDTIKAILREGNVKIRTSEESRIMNYLVHNKKYGIKF